MSAQPPNDGPSFDITQFLGYIEQTVKNILRKLGAGLFLVCKVASAYTTGNPYFSIPGKTGTTPSADKRYKVLSPYAPWGYNAPVADELAGLLEDFDENKHAAGSIRDLAAALLDAQRYGGWLWVKPGNTVTEQSANTERSTASSTYETKKSFQAPYNGRYRVSVELSRSSGTTSAQVWVVLADGTEIAASNEVNEGTATHTDFGAAQNLDMTVTVVSGQKILVKLKNTLATGYIRNAVLKYSEATAIQAPHSAVLID
jgi:hypothetical protein